MNAGQTKSPSRQPRVDVSVYAAVCAGSVIGSLARWLVGVCVHPLAFFPLGTLLVNASGSFAIGFFAALTIPNGVSKASPHFSHFVMTGICGGYTTFSAFSLETLLMLRARHWGTAIAYIGVSVVAWLGAVWIGEALGPRVRKAKPPGDHSP